MNRERFHEVQERIEQVINVLGEHDVTATILETLAKKNYDSEMKMHVSIGAGVTLTCQHPGGGEWRWLHVGSPVLQRERRARRLGEGCISA